ncbi:hypothetical protein ACW5E8_11405 [Luteimonas sp. A649]
MQAMQAERALASSGELRGGTNIGGLVGGLLGNRHAAAVVGGVNLKRSTADVVLTVTDARSSEQVAMTEGHASKTDVGWQCQPGGHPDPPGPAAEVS